MTTFAPETLWDYVLGQADPEVSAEIDRELARSPELAAEVRELSELSVALPLSLPPQPPPAGVKARLLASIAAPSPYRAWMSKLERLFDVGRDKAEELVRRAEDAAHWVASGMPGCDLIHIHDAGPRTAGADVGFVRVAPGFRFPSHRHKGDEVTVVLQGAYRDSFDGRVWRAGDWVVLSEGTEHHYVVEPGEDCVYATVVGGIEITETEGPGVGWTVEGSKAGH